MDFKRIQLVLFAFFALFNVYLVFQLGVDYTSANQQAGASRIITVEQQLLSRGIKIEPNAMGTLEALPLLKTNKVSLVPNGPTLAGQVSVVTDDRISSKLEPALPLSALIDKDGFAVTAEQLAMIQREFLAPETYVQWGSQYTDLIYFPQEQIAAFRTMAYNQVPVVDRTSEIRIVWNEEGQIAAYEQTYRTNFIPLEKTLNLITSEEALRVLDSRVDTYLPEDSTVSQVKLGYYRSMTLQTFDIYSPVWEVVYRTRDGAIHTKLVDAVRGEVIAY